MQDSLERALRKRHLWLRRGSMRSWLFRILYREFLDGRRLKAARTRHATLEDAEAHLVQPARQLSRLHCRQVLEALARLPEDQRAAVSLVALEGFGYDEAAEILGAPVGTLRSRISRGRAALRDMIEIGTTEGEAEEEARPRLRRVK